MYTRFNQKQFIKLSNPGAKPAGAAKPIKPAEPKRTVQDSDWEGAASKANLADKPVLSRIGLKSGQGTLLNFLGGSLTGKYHGPIPEKPAVPAKPAYKVFGQVVRGATPAQPAVPAIPANVQAPKPRTHEERINENLMAGKLLRLTGGRFTNYLAPANVNRAAMLGGLVSGGIAGGNTFKSYGAAGLGSVAGNLAGGYASEGINRAIDKYQGRKSPALIRRILLDTLLGSGAAVAGGYYAGRATR
jgi:hypothetical protein